MRKFKDDWPLMEIHRQYEKDEAMKALFDEISRLKFKIGEQDSGISELKYEIVHTKPKEIEKIVVKEVAATAGKKSVKAWKKDEYFAEIMSRLERANETKKRYEKDVILWRNKYFDLLARTNKDGHE